MDGNEYGKIIDVDFEKGGVNLTYEYERKNKEMEELKAMFRDAVKKVAGITKDRHYSRAVMFQFGDILADLRARLENKYTRK